MRTGNFIAPLMAVVVSTAVVSPASAESVPYSPCTVSWWMASTSISWELWTKESMPTIALPAMWNGDPSKITESDREALVVEVRDSVGTLVAGTLGVGFDDGPWNGHGLSYTGWSRADLLEISAWWHPENALAAGHYTIHVVIPPTTVPPPSSGRAPQNCPYGNYDFDQTFDVRPDLPAPVLAVDYSLVVEPTDYITHSTDCSDRANVAYCSSHPEVCCWFNDGYTHTVSFTWTNLPLGWSFYHVLALEYDSIGYPYAKQSILWHPFPYLWDGSEPYALRQSFNPAPWQLPLPPELCARGQVIDIVDGSIDFEFDGCVQTDNPTRASTQILRCNEATCAELAGVPVPEVAEESISDASAVSVGDVADPGPDGYSPGCATQDPGLFVGSLLLLCRFYRHGELARYIAYRHRRDQ